VGDSRCILGREDASGRIYPEEVTQDHKPDDPIEQRRIERLGGRVEKMMYVVVYIVEGCVWVCVWSGAKCGWGAVVVVEV
jgi:hypothetical protein